MLKYYLKAMHIRIKAETGRRIAFIDRMDGYFQYLFKKDNKEGGYYRGNTKFLREFTCNGHGLDHAKTVCVYPYGFKAEYDDSIFEGALLINEQAFYLSAEKNIGILEALPTVQFYETLPLEGKEAKDNSEEIAKQVKKVPVWTQSNVNGIYVHSCDAGIAIAADFEFNLAVSGEDLSLRVTDSKGLVKSENNFESNGWYLVFDSDEKKAAEKAVRLAKEKGILAHKKLVDEFLNKTEIDVGDKKFNESVQWARLSAWMLATKDHGSNYRGIWAGLPWFRDNWGRDTFISLCGTLLVSGCFDEAKDVLLGFAGFQDLNKESPTYGRIPNRYRDSNDVIYNTVDGTLWFIRALWEYVQYSADISIVEKLKETIDIALVAEMNHCDEHGFLMHSDADTWMDARIEGKEPLSPRGNRANDIQALWFTALKIGAELQRLACNSERADSYDYIADRVRKSFIEYFWNKDCNALADHLPEGGYGEWAKDMRVRPNQLFTFMIPSLLDLREEELFVTPDICSKILKNVNRELVNPFGLYSLSPEDPLFHPEHENPEWYHKDAAYHNGTIWEWNTGAYITGCTLGSRGILCDQAKALLQNYSKMILEYGCAGSLSENIHARPDSNGNPKLSGTFSQAWSVAEYNRNVFQDVIGFNPRLMSKNIKLEPSLPEGCEKASAVLPFGNNWKLKVEICRAGNVNNIEAEWICDETTVPANLKVLTINGEKIQPNQKIKLTTPANYSENCEKPGVYEKFGTPDKWITAPFEKQNLNNEFCGSEHKQNYIFDLIKSGRMYGKCSGGENTGALEWYFDSKEFEKKYHTNMELGALYGKRSTTFRLWAPTAKAVSVSLFKDGENSPEETSLKMEPLSGKGKNGVWEATVKGDLHGKYYLYTVQVHGVDQISSDPYAKACGVNGKRSMVVDMKRTNPWNWERLSIPVTKNPCDAVAYEAHIADISSSPNWNGKKENKRKFLGACEKGTKYNGIPTGFDHIKALGVTHVQLLPVFDFRSVDEANCENEELAAKPTFGNFNWGYDPENYACLEGSYSSNPFDGAARIKEFKELIKAYADAGIGIIMDVVYNHVNDGLHHGLGTSVPGYFYRVEGYSGAGEDTASEHSMFRKYMVDTLSFWLKEYKLCGFRFDLMGLHDVVTMNAIRNALKKIKKDVLIYGEGWDMYRAGKMEGAIQGNSHKMPGIGFFNDAIRDAIKGSVFNDKEKGFIHDGSRKEAIKFGIVGATKHSQIEYDKIEGTAAPKPWGETTWTSVNYTEIHDNITLRDKLFMVEQDKPEEYLDQMQKMALSFVLLSEGYPILHAGMEFCRSKEVPEDIKLLKPVFYEYGISDDGKHFILHNTYNVCDKINNLDWKRCSEKQDVVMYVKKLIQLRKAHPAFRLATDSECQKCLSFIDNKSAGLPEQVLAWELDGSKCGDSWKKILVVANPFTSDVKLELNGKGNWICVTDGKQFLDKPEKMKDGTVVSVNSKAVAIYALS